MKKPGQQQQPSKRSPQPQAHHSQLPIVRITIDDAVLVLGVLELIGQDLDPDSEIAILAGRSAARISARLAGLAEALSPVLSPMADPPDSPASVSPTGERDRRTTASGPPRNERRTPA